MIKISFILRVMTMFIMFGMSIAVVSCNGKSSVQLSYGCDYDYESDMQDDTLDLAELNQEEHAMWLYHCFYATYPYDTVSIEVERYWAWAQQFNDSVKEYNRRIGRCESWRESHEKLTDEIRDAYYEDYGSGLGSTPQITQECAFIHDIYYYKALNMNRILIDAVDNNTVKVLLYQDFRAWHKIYEILLGITYDYTIPNSSQYSLLMADIYSVHGMWCRNRFEALLEGEDVLVNGISFVSDSVWVTSKDLDAMWNMFSSYGLSIEEITRLECAFAEWLAIRQEIASLLPAFRRQSYMELTKQEFSRLYDDAYTVLHIEGL